MSDQLSDLFPDELILDILTRLPAKTLSRFRSVSKTWNSFVTEPHFLTTYLSRNPPTWFTLDRVVQFSDDPSDTHPIRFIPSAHSGVVDLTINPNLLLKPDEPVSEPGSTAVITPSEIIHSSNGLVLFALNVNPDPFKDGVQDGPPLRFSRSAAYDVLIVTNTTTREWARLPLPPHNFNRRHTVTILTRPGPVGHFVVGGFEHNFITGGCSLTCYGSETGKWVKKDAGNPLGLRHWMSFDKIEFQGKMCWCDNSAGIIIWEEDPFVGCVNEKKADCRFIPLPPGHALVQNTKESMMQRCIASVGEWIQYTEMYTHGEIAVEVWRLKGYGNGRKSKKEGKWELVYKVPRIVLLPYIGSKRLAEFCLDSENRVGGVSFVEPFDPDTVIIHRARTMLSLDVRNRVVKNSQNFFCHTCVMSCVVPSLPTSLPPLLYAEYIKEQGNACFKTQNFNEAMKCYSTSIALSPSVVAYGNRAMAYIALGRFCEAEQDCTEALKLDRKFFKAYGRRALAREKLGNFDGALEDVKSALKLQPDNQLMKELYDDLKCLVDKMSLTKG